MELEKYLSSEVVRCDLASGVKDDALKELVTVLCQVNKLPEPGSILQTIFVREEDRSTGMGNGVAIPHARTHLAKSIYLALGRSKLGIEWGSVDGKPAHFIFMVVGPEKASEEYLRVLADISRLMSRATVRRALLEAGNAAEVLKIINQTKVRESRI